MAHKSLYRVWRPEKFAEIAGQDHIVRVLTGEIENERISHAYLFCGPRGTGKTSLAKIFAKAVNCTARKSAEPCGSCGICRETAADNITDIVEIDAASNNGVDNVRDLRDRVNLMPAVCRYKVYIIDEVHMLSAGAFNALLKTLEEPPSHVIFILATTEPHKLPATIRSRCQRFDFKRISATVIAERLKRICETEGFSFSGDALMMIARAAEGGMRDALSILDQCAACGEITAKNVSETMGGGDTGLVWELAGAIARYDEKGALEQLRALLDSGADTRTLIKDLAEIFRRMMWISAGSEPDESEAKLESLAKSFGKRACLRALDILIRKEYEMRLNLRADIVLETAVMALMCPEDDANASDALRIEKIETRIGLLEQNGLPAPETLETIMPAEPENLKTSEKKPAKIKSPVNIDDSAKSDNVWDTLLEALKKDAYFIFTYAQKSSGAQRYGNKLEIWYDAADAMAADYMKQPSAQKAVQKKLGEITGEAISVSIMIKEKSDNTQANASILNMFGADIEEI